jgi:hypothetical protein
MNSRGTGWLAIRQFIYGLTGYEFERHAAQLRREVETVFKLAILGDFVGIPIIPPVYSLRLLPYLLPHLADWKRELAQGKEFWEKEEYDLHGI